MNLFFYDLGSCLRNISKNNITFNIVFKNKIINIKEIK